MDTPNNPIFWRPRADLIRECVAAGLNNAAIKARCLAEGYGVDEKSFRQACYSARKSEGRPVASRPTYYYLCKEYVTAFHTAYASGKVIGHTREMQALIEEMEKNLLQDQTRAPLTKRRKHKGKR